MTQSPSEAADSRAPLLFAATTRIFAVIPIRLGLGVAALAAAAALSEPPVLRHFVIGAILFAFVALASETRRLSAGLELDDVPPNARFASPAATAIDATLPSTLGVAVLAAVAIVFEPRVSSLLGGLLVGMGVAALPGGILLMLWERRLGARVYATPGTRPRLYTRRQPGPS